MSLILKTSLTRDGLSAKGSGINGKLGLIYRINNMFRIGVAFHTPTGMSLREDFYTTMDANYKYDGNDFTPQELEPAYGSFNYSLTTPWKAVLSGAFIIPRTGFISIDYEYMDYSQMNFKFGESPAFKAIAEGINQNIRNTYKSASNIRIGGEWAKDNFRARAGYAFYGSPLQADNSLNRNYITGGLGFREDAFYIDLAYVQALQKSRYYMYSLANDIVEGADVQNTEGNAVVTVGFRF